MLHGLVGCIEILYGLVGCIEILYGLVGRIENLYGLVRKKLFYMLEAFQYTTKQSWLKFKDEKTHSAVYKILYGLVGCIDIRYGLEGCIEFRFGLVGRIKNLYGLVRKKLF